MEPIEGGGVAMHGGCGHVRMKGTFAMIKCEGCVCI